MYYTGTRHISERAPRAQLTPRLPFSPRSTLSSRSAARDLLQMPWPLPRFLSSSRLPSRRKGQRARPAPPPNAASLHSAFGRHPEERPDDLSRRRKEGSLPPFAPPVARET